MARPPVLQRVTSRPSLLDESFPILCTIESSYIADGHGEYSIRVTRLFNDPSTSWTIRKRFREFVDLNQILKSYGYHFDLPKKQFFGNKDREFMAERQKGLQMFLDALVQEIELCHCLAIQRFLHPDHHLVSYSELALQHVSMFIRSMNNEYQIIEPLPDFGWNCHKNYFLGSKTGRPKDEQYLLIWHHYGPDKALADKETTYCLKLIKSISHPLLVPVDEVYSNESGLLTVCRFFPTGSLKDCIHQTKPSTGVYWKRYGPGTSLRTLHPHQIRIISRQILECLDFIYENKLVYGHLHSGNILWNTEQSLSIKLMDIGNAIAGLSGKYRCYYATSKHVHTFEQCDVYGFGRVLYELSTGEEYPTDFSGQWPTCISTDIQQILVNIFRSGGELPSVRALLNEPCFQVTAVNGIERFQLKLNVKTIDVFEQISRAARERLEADRIKIKCAQRQMKMAQHLMSDEEKLKRRRQRQTKALEQQLDSTHVSINVPKYLQDPVPVNPPSETSSLERSVTSTTAIATPPALPSCPPPTTNDDRTQLWTSITTFSLNRLKKVPSNTRETS